MYVGMQMVMNMGLSDKISVANKKEPRFSYSYIFNLILNQFCMSIFHFVIQNASIPVWNCLYIIRNLEHDDPT